MRTAVKGVESLEAQIHGSPIYDAYRNHPGLWGNFEVLRLLADIDRNLRKDPECYRDEDREAEAYEDGEEYGAKCAYEDCHDSLSPLLDAVLGDLPPEVEKRLEKAIKKIDAEMSRIQGLS